MQINIVVEKDVDVNSISYIVERQLKMSWPGWTKANQPTV